MRGLAVVVSFLMCGTVVRAQCVDSLAFPLDNPPCYMDFIPVCGCDGNTYINFCHWQYAALNYYSEGPCEQVSFRFFPNPVVEYLNLSIATRFESDVDLYIFDRNGNIMYQRFLPQVENTQLIIPVYDYRHGIYIIAAQANDETYVDKFVKGEY